MFPQTQWVYWRSAPLRSGGTRESGEPLGRRNYHATTHAPQENGLPERNCVRFSQVDDDGSILLCVLKPTSGGRSASAAPRWSRSRPPCHAAAAAGDVTMATWRGSDDALLVSCVQWDGANRLPWSWPARDLARPSLGLVPVAALPAGETRQTRVSRKSDRETKQCFQQLQYLSFFFPFQAWIRHCAQVLAYKSNYFAVLTSEIGEVSRHCGQRKEHGMRGEREVGKSFLLPTTSVTALLFKWKVLRVVRRWRCAVWCGASCERGSALRPALRVPRRAAYYCEQRHPPHEENAWVPAPSYPSLPCQRLSLPELYASLPLE